MSIKLLVLQTCLLLSAASLIFIGNQKASKYQQALLKLAAAQTRAMMPSQTMAPKKTLRACFSVLQQRAIIGDCVEWKPEMAPQATEMNIVTSQVFRNLHV